MTTLESIESTMTISAKFDQSFELLSLAGTAGTFGTWNFVDIHPLDGTYTDNLVGLGWVGFGTVKHRQIWSHGPDIGFCHHFPPGLEKEVPHSLQSAATGGLSNCWGISQRNTSSLTKMPWDV